MIGPLGPSEYWLILVTVNPDCLLVCLACFLLFCFLQGAAAFSALAGHFTDPELSRLASAFLGLSISLGFGLPVIMRLLFSLLIICPLLSI